MKPLIIFHTHGNIERVQHEIKSNAQHEIAEVITMKLGEDSLPQLTEKNHECLMQIKQLGGVGFIISDERMLNQHRLMAYMLIKRHGLPVAAVQSKTSSIASGIRLRENVYIDHAVRVLAGANIGANSWIMQGSELGAGCKIGSSCWIGHNCHISERAVIGKNCTLGDGVKIDADVNLPDWSVINHNGKVIRKTPKTAIFLDPRFRSEVYIFNKETSN